MRENLGCTLTTIPGVNVITAVKILAEIGDIKRFSNLNKLAQFATNNFDPAHIGNVQSASMGAALAQQSMLSADASIFNSIAGELSGIPTEVGQHIGDCFDIAKKLLPMMANNTANAMSPLFSRQTP